VVVGALTVVAVWCVVVVVAVVEVEGLELQDARSAAAARTTAAGATARGMGRMVNPDCRCRTRSPGIGQVWRRPSGDTVHAMATTRDISYEADDRTMIGTLALPDGEGQRPGVLVCHEGPGLDDHARGRAVRLADDLGYVAFALDYQGGGKPIEDREQMMERIGGFYADPLRVRDIGMAGLEILLQDPRTDPQRLAAIGYCFGGTMALELARGEADLKAVCGFHSGLATARPQDAENIVGKVLVMIGADDPIVDNAQRKTFEEEMTGGGVDWQMVVYGGAVHSFTNPRASNVDIPGIDYHEPTDRRSWQAMCDLFAEVF
jgi:dienelactone hydrolase